MSKICIVRRAQKGCGKGKTAKIKLIIFDLDGTLIDAYRAISSSFNFTMRKLHYPPQKNLIIRKAVGWGDANLLKPFIARADLKKALRIYRSHHTHSLVRASRLMPGVKKMLTFLSNQGYKLAVASNRPTKFSRILLNHLRLKKYFAYLLCADKLKKGKPDPEILNRIIRKFSLAPKEVLYVGDMVIDCRAARAARVKAIIVPTGSSASSEIRKEKPFKIIGELSDLLKVLADFN